MRVVRDLEIDLRNPHPEIRYRFHHEFEDKDCLWEKRREQCEQFLWEQVEQFVDKATFQ